MMRAVVITLAMLLSSASVNAELGVQKHPSPDKLQTDFSPQPLPFDSVDIVKSPLLMKRRNWSRAEWVASRYYTTESAVLRCLRWLKETQNGDGSWGGSSEPKSVATGVALLTFLKHGDTPASVEFGQTIEGGLKYLLLALKQTANADGNRFPAIEHGICSQALCEAYAMTKIPALSASCTNAITAIITTQRPSGLWHMRYEKEQGQDDREASVWQMLALKSALMAGIGIAELRPTLTMAAEGMKKTIGEESKEKKTGPASLSLQCAGYGLDPACVAGLDALRGLTMDWETPTFSNPVYHWYFITQVKFNYGGQVWKEWNKSFAQQLIKRQHIIPEAVDGRWTDKKLDIG